MAQIRGVWTQPTRSTAAWKEARLKLDGRAVPRREHKSWLSHNVTAASHMQ